MSKKIKLYDIIKTHTKEVWYAGECECGESKYDLITEPQAIYPPVHESTIKQVNPELLESD